MIIGCIVYINIIVCNFGVNNYEIFSFLNLVYIVNYKFFVVEILLVFGERVVVGNIW